MANFCISFVFSSINSRTKSFKPFNINSSFVLMSDVFSFLYIILLFYGNSILKCISFVNKLGIS